MSSTGDSAVSIGSGAEPIRRRKDAQRNYDRLLSEARAVVAERGSDASLEEIARRAEVGIATLYRHFPNRTELIRALYEQSLAALMASASDIFSAPSAWEGVSLYVERVAEWLIEDPGLPSIIVYMGTADADYRPGAAIEAPLAALIARAQADGELRPDVNGVDVSILVTMLGVLSTYNRPGQPATIDWRRQLGIVLDGLRAENVRTELPGTPLDADGFHHAVHKN